MVQSTVGIRIHCLAFCATVFLLLTWGIQLDAAEFSCSSGNVTCLVAAINEANGTPGRDTITLEPGIYTVNSATGTGSAGLPSISSWIRIQPSAYDRPTIIMRDPFAIGPERFIFVFDVFIGGELSLEGITVQAPGPFQCFTCRVAIRNQGITTLQNSTVSDSTGAIENTGTLNVLRSIIANNSNFFGTGGLDNDGGTVVVENSTIAHNVASGLGSSGINNTGSLTVRGSAIVFNVNGGDIFSDPTIGNSGSVEINNSTIAKNVSFFGPVIRNAGVFSLTNSTVRENETEAEGASPAIGWLQGTIQVKNTIVAGNNSTICLGTIASLGNNLLDDPSCSINLQPSDLSGDPGVGTLVGTGDDDPPGRVYYPVLAGSPVINKGTPNACPKTDQLGNTRDGVCDIGSVEFQSGVPITIDVKPGDDDNFINLNGNSTISVAILGIENFDVSAVNLSTVKFGRNQTSVRQNATPLRDVNGDGLLDLVMSFRTRETGISCNDTSLFLSGQTSQGVRIFGFDVVNPSGC